MSKIIKAQRSLKKKGGSQVPGSLKDAIEVCCESSGMLLDSSIQANANSKRRVVTRNTTMKSSSGFEVCGGASISPTESATRQNVTAKFKIFSKKSLECQRSSKGRKMDQGQKFESLNMSVICSEGHVSHLNISQAGNLETNYRTLKAPETAEMVGNYASQKVFQYYASNRGGVKHFSKVSIVSTPSQIKNRGQIKSSSQDRSNVTMASNFSLPPMTP